MAISDGRQRTVTYSLRYLRIHSETCPPQARGDMRPPATLDRSSALHQRDHPVALQRRSSAYTTQPSSYVDSTRVSPAPIQRHNSYPDAVMLNTSSSPSSLSNRYLASAVLAPRPHGAISSSTPRLFQAVANNRINTNSIHTIDGKAGGSGHRHLTQPARSASNKENSSTPQLGSALRINALSSAQSPKPLTAANSNGENETSDDMARCVRRLVFASRS